jgi:hypothetical protein
VHRSGRRSNRRRRLPLRPPAFHWRSMPRSRRAQERARGRLPRMRPRRRAAGRCPAASAWPSPDRARAPNARSSPPSLRRHPTRYRGLQVLASSSRSTTLPSADVPSNGHRPDTFSPLVIAARSGSHDRCARGTARRGRLVLDSTALRCKIHNSVVAKVRKDVEREPCSRRRSSR